MITIWTFVLLGFVLAPCGVLALIVWNTWKSTAVPTDSTVERIS